MVRCICALTLATALALALVWQGAGMRRAGYAVERLHEQISDQQAQSASLEAQLSKLKNPERVTTLVAYLGLDLRPPVPPAEAAPAAGVRQSKPVSIAAANGF